MYTMRVVEYMKAVDAPTINEKYRLKKKIVEYEGKLKDVPRIEQLKFHLANKEKHEQEMKAIREEMENKFQKILAKIDTAKLT
jgi:dynactin complex subunit